MCLIGFAKRFELYDPRLVSNSPGHDLFCVLSIVRFDDGPTAVRAIVTAPFEMVQVACRVDFSDDRIAVACIVR